MLSRLKSKVLKPYGKYHFHRVNRDMIHCESMQEKWLMKNVRSGRATGFGKDHGLDKVTCYEDYKKAVPVREYEALRPYIERMLQGENSVLWPGTPKYVIGTSGTTSGIKYIPLTRESMPYHFNSARNASFHYCYKYGMMDMFDGDLLFMSGSPILGQVGNYPSGRLSGIVNHEIPAWLRRNQLPSYEINCIEEWRYKVESIAQESLSKDVRMISGIPPWMMMFLEEVLRLSGREKVADVFPQLRLIIHGGVDITPYKKRLDNLIGSNKVKWLETYPSTEGFIGFQDDENRDDLSLNANAGVFYEFIPIDQVKSDNPDRYSIAEIELDQDYAIVLSNNAGLWCSMIGDVVRFSTRNPYRLKIVGRVSHFLSAFGEHIIGQDVDLGLKAALEKSPAEVVEYSVAPCVDPGQGIKPYHEWFIEFSRKPEDINSFRNILNKEMMRINFHYKELIEGYVIQPLKIYVVPPGGFRRFYEKSGRLGGQNKVVRVSNDRMYIDSLLEAIKDMVMS